MGDAVDVGVKTALLKQVREWDTEFSMEHFVLAFDLIESEDEFRKALNDPAGFLKKLHQEEGPEAKRFMIAKLRPKLTENLQNHGLQWEEARLRSLNTRH